jgi:galactokinase
LPRERSAAFAPGRVNLIGEHTDYNRGLALPFAIADGITVRAWSAPSADGGEPSLRALAADLDERDEFRLSEVTRADGWRAFVRGVVAELQGAGVPLVGSRIEIAGDIDRGAGLSSSAALEVALALALSDLAAGHDRAQAAPSHAREPLDPERAGELPAGLERMELARLCSRVENEWVGAQTGLLDQIASLYGGPQTALHIDFDSLEVEPVPLRLEGWRLVLLHSGERHANASSGYNERRAECARACELLGVGSLREADRAEVDRLPAPERLRAQHVLGENERVREAAAALREEDLTRVGPLLNESHASQRDLFQVSTPAVETAVERLRRAGASGARLMGGGFGGSVLGLFAPETPPPPGTLEVRPSAGAHLLDQA